MAPPRRFGGSIRILVVLLLLGVAVGAAAALLSPPPGTPPSNEGNPGLIDLLSFQTAGYVVLGFTLALMLSVPLLSFSGGGRIALRPLLVAFVAFMVTAIIFLALIRAFAPTSTPWNLGGPLPPGGSNETGTNASLNCTSVANCTGLNPNGTGGTGGVQFFWSALPGWVILLAVVALAVVVAAVVSVLSRMRLPTARSDAPVAATRADLREALDTLEGDPAADVRTVIIRLYAKLLRRIDPHEAYTETLSAREIATSSVETLGLHPDTARELTALFEEARYSTHALPPEAADRARKALARALEELHRRPVAS